MTSEITMAQTLSSNEEDFYKINKVTTDFYRDALAQAIGSSGTLPVIKKMAFGDQGNVDSYGNPAPPDGATPLNHVVVVKEIEKTTFTDTGKVTFEAQIVAGDIGDTEINELALLDETERTCAKIRLANDMGINQEIGAVIRWTVSF